MSHVVTSTNVNVSVATYEPYVMDAARAALEGYDGQYYFFQYNIDCWALIMYDEGVYSNYGLTASDCQIVQIDRLRSSSSVPVVSNLNGTLIGTEEQALTARLTSYETVTTESYYIQTYHVNSVSVSNPSGMLVYSSMPNCPKLIEGVQNYAYAQTLLLCGIILFKLFDRIFRRVY